jgi:dTDP-4-amino-4,6-dideoxygalactose transaminase
MTITQNLETPAILGGSPTKTTPFPTHQRYGKEELQELQEALQQNSLFYVHGKKVATLEQELAKALHAKFAVATSSGTASVHAALIAAGISPGDEVITSPITDMGTISPILYQGAVPVFADVDPHNANLDPAAVEKAITPKTKAIVAVHLAGIACDMDALKKIADKHNLTLIEDCAQSWGCTWNGKPVGNVGHIGCYSFNEFKHLSCGDGGITITSDPELAKRLRLATDKCYNRASKDGTRDPVFLGNNYRMNELQGAVSLAQLRKLPEIAKFHNEYGTQLLAALNSLPGIIAPKPPAQCYPTYWFLMFRIDPTVLHADNKAIAAAIAAEGIPAGAGYIKVPVYHYPVLKNHTAFPRGHHAYESQDYQNTHCPTAEKILNTCIQLQIHVGYTPTDLEETTRALRKVITWYQQNP